MVITILTSIKLFMKITENSTQEQEYILGIYNELKIQQLSTH
jgi:hypothetical protein